MNEFDGMVNDAFYRNCNVSCVYLLRHVVVDACTVAVIIHALNIAVADEDLSCSKAALAIDVDRERRGRIWRNMRRIGIVIECECFSFVQKGF